MRRPHFTRYPLAIGMALCVTLAALARPPVAKAPQKTMLWKVSSSGKAVFLLGSLHLLKAEDYPLPAAFEKAFTNSTSVVFEVDPKVLHAADTTMKLMKAGMLPEGDGLSKQLSAKTYALLKAKLKEIGMDIAGFERFRPWFLSLTLSMGKLQAMGFSPLHGIDRHYSQRAAALGRPTSGLETIDEQLGFFKALDKPAQEGFILQTLEEMETMEKQMLTMRTSWRTGNTNQLAAILLKDADKHPEVYETLFTARNKNWLPKIEALFKRKDRYLVIVGAGHLVGKDGLLDLLKKKGYTLQQL